MEALSLILDYNNNVRVIDDDELELFFKKQRFGSLVCGVLKGWSKKRIAREMELETEEKYKELVIETINFVKNTPRYEYNHKYDPSLRSSKTKVLKKLNTLLKQFK